MTKEEILGLFNQLQNLINDLTQKFRRHKHQGIEDEQMDQGIIIVPMSFETGEQTATRIYFPFAVRITKHRGIVTKAIAGTDNGTITGANNIGDSSNGVITATASDALNTEYSVSPTTNNEVPKDSWYRLTSAKTTAGGKVLVTLEFRRI